MFRIVAIAALAAVAVAQDQPAPAIFQGRVSDAHCGRAPRAAPRHR
jgi:hypothetical protein